MSALHLLTVLNDPARAEMYARLAQRSGLQVTGAEGPLHALTQIERSRVDALICDEALEDMTGQELCAILADDGATRQLPVYLMPAPLRDLGKGALDRDVLSGPEVLRLAMGHLGLDPGQAAVPVAEHAPQLEGELHPFSLPDFLHWLAELGYSGHWLLRVRDGESSVGAHVAMRAGQLCYAEFAGLTGKAALRELLRVIGQGGRAEFRYYHEPELHLERTEDFTLSTARLLIELAVDLDEAQFSLH